MIQFDAPLKPFISRLRRESVLKACFLALAAGVVTAFTAMCIMRIFALPYVWGALLGIVGGVAVVTGVVSYFLLFHLSLKDTVRRIDEAGLEERVTTMQELWDDTSYIAKLQRQDTLRRLKELRPRSIPLHLPLIAAVVTASVSLTTVAAACIPPRVTRVDVDAPIYDDYAIYDPVVKDLVEEIYKTVENLPDSIPPSIRDEINDIVKDLEDINNGEEKSDLDKVSDLEDALDRIDELIKEQILSPSIRDVFIRFETLRELGEAIGSRDPEKVRAALDGMYLTLEEQLERLYAVIRVSDATAEVRDALTAELDALLAKIRAGNPLTYRPYTDEECFSLIRDTYTRVVALGVLSETSIEVCLTSQEEYAALAQALCDLDIDAVYAALTAMENATVTLTGEALLARLQILSGQLNAALAQTDDPLTDDLHYAFVRMGELLSDAVALAEAEDADTDAKVKEVFDTAVRELGAALAQNRYDSTLVDTVARSLDEMIAGTYFGNYLSTIAQELKTALVDGCHFSTSTEAPLVQALFELQSGLESAARNANSGADVSDQLTLVLDTACTKICEALKAEEELEKVLEDMKQQIEDAIDEIMDEEKDDVTDVESGEKEEEEKDPSNDPQTPPEEQKPNPGNPSGGGGEDEMSGLTFYNPLTGKEEVLTAEALANFKAQMDAALATGTYTAEQRDAMNRYYELVSQKFEEENTP